MKKCHKQMANPDLSNWKCIGENCALWDKDKNQCGDVTNRESLKSISESLKDLHVGIAK